MCTAVCTCQVWDGKPGLAVLYIVSIACQCALCTQRRESLHQACHWAPTGGTTRTKALGTGCFCLCVCFAVSFLAALSVIVLSVSCMAAGLFTAIAKTAKAALIPSLNTLDKLDQGGRWRIECCPNSFSLLVEAAMHHTQYRISR